MFNEDYGEYFTDRQVAKLLGMNPTTLRRWRMKNKAAGGIKYGPPYEIHGSRILYPKARFYTWCSQVRVVDGVPHINAPITSDPSVLAELEQLSTAKESADAQAS